GRQPDDPLRTADLQAEARPRAVPGPVGPEGADGAPVEAVGGVDVVAGDRAHALAALADVGLRDRLAPLPHPGVAPAPVAREEARQVEDVGAEYHEVLAAAPAVLLAAAAQLDEVAQSAVREQVPHHTQARAVARLVGDGQLDVVRLAGGHHLVGLGQRPAHRLFEEDAGPGPGAGDRHVPVGV